MASSIGEVGKKKYKFSQFLIQNVLVLLFDDVYGIYLVGLANDGILEGCEYLNLKFSIHLGDFCIEEVFWLGQGFPTNMFVGVTADSVM